MPVPMRSQVFEGGVVSLPGVATDLSASASGSASAGALTESSACLGTWERRSTTFLGTLWPAKGSAVIGPTGPASTGGMSPSILVASPSTVTTSPAGYRIKPNEPNQ